MNFLMLISLVAAQYILYKILLHYGLPFGWSATFGILIGLLTPQVERWTGHFRLGLYPVHSTYLVALYQRPRSAEGKMAPSNHRHPGHLLFQLPSSILPRSVDRLFHGNRFGRVIWIREVGAPNSGVRSPGCW